MYNYINYLEKEIVAGRMSLEEVFTILRHNWVMTRKDRVKNLNHK